MRQLLAEKRLPKPCCSQEIDRMVHQGTSREEPALDHEKNIIHDFTLSEVNPSMLPKAYIRTGHGIMEVYVLLY